MIETRQLQCFVKCSEVGSFSRAAEELHTTQPNVSKIIKSLERELGVELFTRQKNGVQLNKYGREIYPFACDAMHSLQQIEDFVENLKK